MMCKKGIYLESIAQRLGVIENNKAAAERDRAAAALDYAQAAQINSQKGRIGQEVNYRRTSDPLSVLKGKKVDTSGVGVIGPAEYVPPQIPMSKRTGVEAGTRPGTIDVVMPDGRNVNLMAPDLNMDELNQLDMFYQRAVHKMSDAMYNDHVRIKGWIERQIDRIKKTRFKKPGYLKNAKPYRRSDRRY